MNKNSDSRRASTVLELEGLARIKAMEEINEWSRLAEEEAVRDCSARGIPQSGILGGRIASIHRERAKRMVDSQIALRRETLRQAPEVATEESLKSLLGSAYATIDGVLKSIPEHLERRGFHMTADGVRPKDEFEAHALKAHSNREIEILKREHELRVSEQETRLPTVGAKDKRRVWIVHGRNLDARDAMCLFLRSIGLEPMEWGEALALTGKGTPYTGEVLDHAFAEAQAVVVLLTGDDFARLGKRFVDAHDTRDETDLTPQARPNVLFEAGMAFGKYPERTVLVQLGKTRPFSDVIGRNVLCISNELKKRQGLADRLRTAGCDVKTDHRTDWHFGRRFQPSECFTRRR